MKVVLLKNISNLGKERKIKEVSDGYVYNSLLPQGAVRIAKESDLNRKHQKSYQEVKADKSNSVQKKIKKSLAGKSFKFKSKTDENGHLYGSVNAQMVAEEIRKQGYDIDNDQVELEPIKKIGSFKTKINFGNLGDISIPINVEKE